MLIRMGSYQKSGGLNKLLGRSSKKIKKAANKRRKAGGFVFTGLKGGK
jgi:hypothetical protein